MPSRHYKTKTVNTQYKMPTFSAGLKELANKICLQNSEFFARLAVVNKEIEF
jgi:hypothetical protein